MKTPSIFGALLGDKGVELIKDNPTKWGTELKKANYPYNQAGYILMNIHKPMNKTLHRCIIGLREHISFCMKRFKVMTEEDLNEFDQWIEENQHKKDK